MTPRRWWPGQGWLLSDAALTVAVVILELALQLHARDMGWSPPVLAVRIPVVVAVLLVRRRLPVLAMVLAVADTVLAGQVSAALPVAAYAVTAYRPRWPVRLPVLVAGAVAVGVAVAPDWDDHAAVVVSGCFVLWPATLGAYVPARAQLVAATRERAERAERAQHEAARRAVFDERVRIAGEMHDVVGHRVSLMVLHAGAVEMAADDPGRVRALADQMQAAGRQALQELRQLVGLLRTEDPTRPAPLEPQPTLADIPGLLEQSQLAGMDVTVHPTGQVRVVTEMVERTAYRLVQEALTNAGRHAPGGRVLVTLDYRPDALAVSVCNGPATRAPVPVTGSGSGLIGMRERAKALGGQLRADPQLDGGFNVEAVLPA